VFKTGKILFIFIFLISFGIQAQVDTIKNKLRKDTVATLYGQKNITAKVIKQVADTLNLKTFKPDPIKVVWMAAIIPGYGQILNRKYWKLPIVYGGFLGCAYALSWNSGMYQTYLTAYRDIITPNDPTANSYLQLLPKGRTIDDFGGTTAFAALLKTKQDVYRRYRDLSIIATIGFYALTIVDAYVDAQLYDFDISPDLSMRIQPTLLRNDISKTNTFGMQCSINF
jgi:hypothetical protein